MDTIQLPDILDFSPWDLNDEDLKQLKIKLKNELISLIPNKREYLIKKCMMLNQKINEQKMRNWCLKIEENQFKFLKLKEIT